MGATIASLLLLALMITLACNTGAPTQEELQAEVVSALDTLAAELVAERPNDAASYTERLMAYLDAHPAFYGSAVALLDRDGGVTASPCVYRTADGYATLDLAMPSYGIESQAWVTAPLAAKAGVWTAPYFDAGGGEIWMVTRSSARRRGYLRPHYHRSARGSPRPLTPAQHQRHTAIGLGLSCVRSWQVTWLPATLGTKEPPTRWAGGS